MAHDGCRDCSIDTCRIILGYLLEYIPGCIRYVIKAAVMSLRMQGLAYGKCPACAGFVEIAARRLRRRRVSRGPWA